jgi:hypothetical protein
VAETPSLTTWRKIRLLALERRQTRFPSFPHPWYGEPLSGSPNLPHQTRKKLIFRYLQKIDVNLLVDVRFDPRRFA